MKYLKYQPLRRMLKDYLIFYMFYILKPTAIQDIFWCKRFLKCIWRRVFPRGGKSVASSAVPSQLNCCTHWLAELFSLNALLSHPESILMNFKVFSHLSNTKLAASSICLRLIKWYIWDAQNFLPACPVMPLSLASLPVHYTTYMDTSIWPKTLPRGKYFHSVNLPDCSSGHHHF